MSYAIWTLCTLNALLLGAVIFGVLRQGKSAGAARIEERDKWAATVADAREARDEADQVAELYEGDADDLAAALKISHERLGVSRREAHGSFCHDKGACALVAALDRHDAVPKRLEAIRSASRAARAELLRGVEGTREGPRS